MPKTTLKAGTVVWIPCELKTGIFPTEQHVKIEVNIGDRETILGFMPKEDIRQTTPDRGFVRAVVMHVINSKVALLFRGEILSESNPVTVPRQWLEEIAQPEA
jgi:hypothetical protein